MAIERTASRLLTADEAGQRLGLAPRSLLDRRFRLRVVLVGHRAREDLHVGGASRRNAVGGSLGKYHELRALFVDIDFKATPETEVRGRLDRFLLKPSFVIASGVVACTDTGFSENRPTLRVRPRKRSRASGVWRFDFLQGLYVTEARW